MKASSLSERKPPRQNTVCSVILRPRRGRRISLVGCQMRSNGEILRRSGGFAASAPQNDSPFRQAARFHSLRRWALGGLLIALLLGACAPATPDAPSSTLKLPSPAATSRPTEQALVSPPATATLVPTLTPLPTATPRPTPSPGQLVVVHTNDNWGETEPCG